MAVSWEWKDNFGYIEQKNGGRVDLYQANCKLGCQIWHNDEKGEYIFNGFWGDTEHLKRCLGLNKNGRNIYSEDGIIEVVLDPTAEESMAIAKYFSKVGYRVVLTKDFKHSKACDESKNNKEGK